MATLEDVKGLSMRKKVGALGIKHYVTTSDAGAVRLFTNNSSVNFHNGYGDGYTYIIIVENKEHDGYEYIAAKELMGMGYFLGIIEGEWNISSHDCDNNKAVKTLNGRYAVYSVDGVVFFERL